TTKYQTNTYSTYLFSFLYIGTQFFGTLKMASYGQKLTDEYGNPIDQHATGGTKGDQYGTGGLTGVGATGTPGMHGTGTGAKTGTHGVGLSTGTHGQSQLQRSGSSSSSSSEDDGMGGRRKKGIKEKIKEKLPGGHKQEQQTHTTTGEYGTTATGEKKGMVEKIKEKLPGGDQH
ncbi:hypothetical protein ACR2YT_27350, partial [Klebsiella pneumoniae]